MPMSQYDQEAQAVAEAYAEALESLAMNSRIEINNLTTIARDNIEYAIAIAKVLEEHIKKVPAPRKLPAIYLLDSIVKNVGTPYTLYFGKKLYNTFMDAYASVDNNTRRKMDELLKTWKEPIPGSMDTRPVFGPDHVRPIENALLKARTNILQAQQEHVRAEQMLLRPQSGQRNRNTPPTHRQGGGGQQGMVPPPFTHPDAHNGAQYGGGAAPGPQYPYQQPTQGHMPPRPPSSTPSAMAYPPPPTAQPAFGVPGASGAGQGISVEQLTSDVDRLIAVNTAEWPKNPHDPGFGPRMKALMDLKIFLQQNQSLSQEHLQLIRQQVDALSPVAAHRHDAQKMTPTPPAAPQYHAPPAIHHHPVAVGVVPPAPPASAPPTAGLNLDALLGSGALAALLARNSATPQPPTPQPPVASLPQAYRPPPAQQQPAQTPNPPVAAAVNPLALLEKLRASGALSATPPVAQAPAPAKAPPPAPAANHIALLEKLRASGILSGAGGGAPPAVPVVAPTPVSLSASSHSVITAGPGALHHHTPAASSLPLGLQAAALKQFRPYIMPRLYESLGVPCTQCGRRFTTDAKGRALKSDHMDWHFRTHQRMTEAEKKGSHRSYYVDQKDWIKSREVVDTDHVNATASGDGQGSGAAQEKKVAWIPVPTNQDPRSVCPICQERFEQKWLDEAQEWVWMDAIEVRGRIYHASCHAEAAGADPLYARNTPDPVLGKRKAEKGHAFRNKAKASDFY